MNYTNWYSVVYKIVIGDCRVTEQLGSGQFGTVNRGVWQDGKACVEVAVKVLQEGTSEKDTVRFLQEAAINGQFKHPNIVQLLGVVTVGKPVGKHIVHFRLVYTEPPTDWSSHCRKTGR